MSIAGRELMQNTEKNNSGPQNARTNHLEKTIIDVYVARISIQDLGHELADIREEEVEEECSCVPRSSPELLVRPCVLYQYDR